MKKTPVLIIKVFSLNLRSLRWLAVLFLFILIIVDYQASAVIYLKQSFGVKKLLQASADISIENLDVPFVCLRSRGSNLMIQKGYLNLHDEYLRGVAWCLTGENKAGLDSFLSSLKHNSLVQAAGVMVKEDEEKSAGLLELAGLSPNDLKIVIKKLIALPEVDGRYLLRLLARQAGSDRETWQLWLQVGARIEETGNWEAALEWIREGWETAPEKHSASLYLRAGWIYLVKIKLGNPETALSYLNRSIEIGNWLKMDDGSFAHIYKGDVIKEQKYQNWQKLAEIEYLEAIKISPENYWALLALGHLYLYDINDFDRAEIYIQRAIQVNEDHPNAYLLLGDINLRRGDQGTAEYWYKQALLHKPDWQTALDKIKKLDQK